MLSPEDNKLLCSVSTGSAMGEVFRSVWLPAVLSSQLPKPGGAPVRLRLLGEDLVAYRDRAGQVGIVSAYCAHRRAPLFYGRVEEHGIRCAYHGWLYDETGACKEVPSEPGNERLCSRMHISAYPTQEKADIVWIFMGTGAPPALPRFPWIDLPKGQRSASVWVQETNWAQGMEGEIDSSHVSILHRSKSLKNGVASLVHRPYTFLDPSPRLYAHDTPIGFMSVARRRADEQFYWRVTQWMMPMFSLVPSAVWPVSGRAWVPIDDENTYSWDFAYASGGDIPEDFKASVEHGDMFPPQSSARAYRTNTGSIIDTFVPLRTAANSYLIDRDVQAEDHEITGIRGINDQDRAVQEGMGRITDRSLEKLVGSDITVVTARRKLLAIARSGDALEAFRRLIADGSAYSCRPVDAVEPVEDIAAFLATAPT